MVSMSVFKSISVDEVFESTNVISEEQRLILLNIAASDREIKTGQYLVANRKARVAPKWKAITLNSRPGARKTATQWRVEMRF